MFIDHVNITVEGGKGGDGVVDFVREKYIIHGGPAGGSGGRGGDVIFEVDKGLRTLLDFRYQGIYRAKPGEKGQNKNKTGSDAKDMILKIPPGTVVYNAKTDEFICDLVHDKEQKVAAHGGRGGRGNKDLAKAGKHQLEISENGEPGEHLELRLELKLLADVGLVGLPSVGKSTLISIMSNVKPKIAAYHFTTLKPNLGMVKASSGDYVVADLPGLIEGASQGKGLGIKFLKHIERTRLILHVLDMGAFEQRDPIKDYETINKELEGYGLGIEKKGQIVVANKMDLPNAEENLTLFKEKFPDVTIVEVSGLSKEGINELKEITGERLQHLSKELNIGERIVKKVYRFDPSKGFDVIRDEDGFLRVEGEKIDRLLAMSNLNSHDNVIRFQNQLKYMGVYDELAKVTAEDGETVYIGDFEFEYEK